MQTIEEGSENCQNMTTQESGESWSAPTPCPSPASARQPQAPHIHHTFWHYCGILAELLSHCCGIGAPFWKKPRSKRLAYTCSLRTNSRIISATAMVGCVSFICTATCMGYHPLESSKCRRRWEGSLAFVFLGFVSLKVWGECAKLKKILRFGASEPSVTSEMN